MSNVIKALNEDGWHITFEYNYKGVEVHKYNPRINIHRVCEPSLIKKFDEQLHFTKRHDRLKKEYDKYVNFSGSLEIAKISPEEKSEYFWPLKMRRAKNANICYYDQSMVWAGLTDKKYMGWTGEIFFPVEEHERIKSFLKPFKRKYIILFCLRGTMWQKAVYPIVKDICTEWQKKYPDTVIITTGDEQCQQWEWEHDNVVHMSGRMPYKDALLMTRYVDMVITPETGLGIGAGAYETPKIMMLTAASLKNVVGNDKNDFSIQSDAWCSPCTRAIYNTNNCPTMKFPGYKVNEQEPDLPICVNFDKKRVLNRMQEIYDLKIPRNWDKPENAKVYM